ncbi:MAG: 16S rRNA (uracil(1498)-N(3))-methyltransferase [Candidatus Aminicenantia bacterium]
MTANRFFIEHNQIFKNKAILKGREHHHLSKVVRIKEKEKIWLFDEEGNSYLAQVEEIKKKETHLSILKVEERPTNNIKIVLAQALIKPSKMELVIQKATELGIDEFIPVITAWSRTIPEEKILTQKLVRWRRIALEAIKQSGGFFVPKIASPLHLSDLLRRGEKENYFLNEKGGEFLKEIIINSLTTIPESVLLLIGPEGGWSEEEEKQMLTHGFKPVSLGKKILRTETATISSLAIIIHFWKN